MSIRWSLLPSLLSTPRSSHTAAVTRAGRLLVYSGELRPRIPVDAALHVLNLRDPTPVAPWRALDPSPALSAAPEPRVGATAVYDPRSNSLYVWGGRGGVDAAPLGPFQAGVWKAPLDGLDSANSILWERLPAVNDDDSDAAPALTSFHSSVLVEVRLQRRDLLIASAYLLSQGKLYVHAGCPTAGRLASLHAYDLATHTWHKLADAPDQPRGGTALAAVSLPSNPAPVLIRFGGWSRSVRLTSCTSPPQHRFRGRPAPPGHSGPARRLHAEHRYLDDRLPRPGSRPWLPGPPLRARSPPVLHGYA